MKLAVVFFAVFAVCSADSDDEIWKKHKALLGSSVYNAAKDAVYKKNFLLAKKAVDENNKKYEQKQAPFKLKLNEYSHLTEEEFYKFRTGRRSELGANVPATKYVRKGGLRGSLPQTVDWRGIATTPVKNQGTCGSCFSFSTAAVVEGQVLRQGGRNISLANQQILDCSNNYGNHGCGGGMEVNAWRYLQDKEGLMAFDDYPYETRQGQCRYKKNIVKAKVVSFKRHLRVTNDELKEIVATNGPVCVAIHVVKGAMQDYAGGGVYKDNVCRNDMQYLNHAVTLVGYGTSSSGEPYWIIKNSWGDWWGNAGYLYINMATPCGTTTDVSYPEVQLV